MSTADSCPKCHFSLDASPDTCPRCGLIFSKWHPPATTPISALSTTPAPLPLPPAPEGPTELPSAPTSQPAPSPVSSAPATTSRRRLLIAAVLVLGLALLVVLSNYMLVTRHVSAQIHADTRNAGLSLAAHFDYYVNPGTLVLDLRDVHNASPADLFRVLFSSAAALQNAGRRFDRVHLARSGVTVFVMKGEDFATLGAEHGRGQNPIYLIRTLPEKLFTPTGEAAFGHWEGGWLGVMNRQMEDSNKAALSWAEGRLPGA